MKIVHTASELHTLKLFDVGFVPTMGALHSGHLSLIKTARKTCKSVVMSIFVNPTQFGKNEDFGRYPRPIEDDKRMAEQAGADILFLPSVEVIYPGGTRFSTRVHVPALGRRLCGKSRPGHFDGVTSVVARLFALVSPQKAFFGEKDFQQLAILKKMVADLSLPVDVVGCPIIRESDGLAMSSRNRYLTPEERRSACRLSQALDGIRDAVKNGEVNTAVVIDNAKLFLEEDKAIRLDYLDICNEATLKSEKRISGQSRVFIAAFLGKTRLIDNKVLH